MGSQVNYLLMDSGRPLHGLSLSSTQEDIKNTYDKWADKYDDDVNDLGYSAPVVAVKAFLDFASKHAGICKDSKIIDVGAGTGLTGELLKKQGFTNIHALDISPGMLEIAKRKNCYKKLICGGIGNNSIGIADNAYDALFCIGCIIIGGISRKDIGEMLNMIRPGGMFILTVRLDVNKEEFGCKDIIDTFTGEKKIEIIHKEKIDNLQGIGDKDDGRHCYLYCFIKN